MVFWDLISKYFDNFIPPFHHVICIKNDSIQNTQEGVLTTYCSNKALPVQLPLKGEHRRHQCDHFHKQRTVVYHQWQLLH